MGTDLKCPQFHMINNLDKYRFSIKFDDEGFIQYLALIFEDEKHSEEDLKPIIFEIVIKAVELYNKNNRDVNLAIYVTQCVKVMINKYKETGKLDFGNN